MKQWIGHFFDKGHSLQEILDMPYEDYLYLVDSISELRAKESGTSISKNLRPVQKDAIKRRKELNKVKHNG